MNSLYAMKVVKTEVREPWANLLPDPEVARIKNLTREQVLGMKLSDIEHAAKVGNSYAEWFLIALAERFNPELE